MSTNRVASAPRAAALIAVPFILGAASTPAQHVVQGELLSEWELVHDAPVGFLDRAAAVEVRGSTVFVTGASLLQEVDGPSSYLTEAYDLASGALLWSASYSGSPGLQNEPADLAVTPDGARVIVTGRSTNPAQIFLKDDIATVAYDAATGAELWAVRYDGPTANQDQASDLAVSPDGSRVFVIGATGSAIDRDFVTLSYAVASGALAWSATYSGTLGGNDEGEAVTVSPDGARVFVSGRTSESGFSSAHTVVAYDSASGLQQWASVAPFGSGPSFLALDPAGTRLFFAGSRSTGESVLSFDPGTGTQLWVGSYSGVPRGLAVSPGGARVCVTGSVYLPWIADDMRTRCYDGATGAELWTADYTSPNGDPGLDEGLGVAIDPSGSLVFATGRSDGPGTGADTVTLAYDLASGTCLLYTSPSPRD